VPRWPGRLTFAIGVMDAGHPPMTYRRTFTLTVGAGGPPAVIGARDGEGRRARWAGASRIGAVIECRQRTRAVPVAEVCARAKASVTLTATA
jgi:hypothetical protein